MIKSGMVISILFFIFMSAINIAAMGYLAPMGLDMCAGGNCIGGTLLVVGSCIVPVVSIWFVNR